MRAGGSAPRPIRGVSGELRLAARALRQKETPAERELWEALRDRRLAGLRFRRQHAIGTLVLDFYGPAQRLVVEVDGAIHDDPAQVDSDASRDAHLLAAGYRVLRFKNHAVLTDLPSVLTQIQQSTDQPNRTPAQQP